MPADLMTEAECAEMLGLRPKTLSNLRSRNEGPPYVRLASRGGSPRPTIRYSRHAIAGWIAACTVTPGSTA